MTVVLSFLHFGLLFVYCQGFLFDDLFSVLFESTTTTTTTAEPDLSNSPHAAARFHDCPTYLPRNKRLIFNPLSSKCYQFINTKKSWEDARGNCFYWGGQLAMINSTQNDVFLELSGSLALGQSHDDRYMWTGLRDENGDGVYRWVSGQVSSYARWQTGHPITGSGSMCAAINRETAHWESSDCNKEYQSLCEYEKDAKLHRSTTKATSTTTLTTTTRAPEHQGECPFCSNERNITRCRSTRNCQKGSEACTLTFTKDGATAGCSSDIIKCYQNKRHNSPECSYRPIPFEANPNVTCSYCCDITLHNCFTDILSFSVYAQGHK